jgi:hypothetical protein
MGRPARHEIEKFANDAYAVARDRILKEYTKKKSQALVEVRRTGNSGGYLPALTKWGTERTQAMILARADTWVEAFKLHGVPSDVQAEQDLQTSARQEAAGTISSIRGDLQLRAVRLRIAQEGRGIPWHLDIERAMNTALEEGVLRLKRQRIEFRDSERANVSKNNGITNLGQLMRILSQPDTPEYSAFVESILSAQERLDPHNSQRTLARIERTADQMRVSEDAFRAHLPALLQEFRLDMPEGVRQPPRGRRGRPPSATTGEIHAEWVRMGKLKITGRVCDRLAKHFFPTELQEVAPGSPEHKRARERIRQALKRSKPLAT